MPHAAYIARIGPYAKRIEKGDRLVATETGNMPVWAVHDPLVFWMTADAFERANGTTYREMEIALPRELTADEQVALVRDFVRQEIGDRHAFQWAIHSPPAADGGTQPHAHLMFSERQVDGIERDPEQYFKRYNTKTPDRGGARKGYGANGGKTLTRAERAGELKALRSRWEILCNGHLELAGQSVRIDMRSHADRGLDIAPEKKQLPSTWQDPERRSVILELRTAKAEQAEAVAALKEAVPDISAVLIDIAWREFEALLAEERKRREQEKDARRREEERTRRDASRQAAAEALLRPPAQPASLAEERLRNAAFNRARQIAQRPVSSGPAAGKDILPQQPVRSVPAREALSQSQGLPSRPLQKPPAPGPASPVPGPRFPSQPVEPLDPLVRPDGKPRSFRYREAAATLIHAAIRKDLSLREAALRLFEAILQLPAAKVQELALRIIEWARRNQGRIRELPKPLATPEDVDKRGKAISAAQRHARGRDGPGR